MIASTYAGQDIYVLPYGPNWADVVTLTATVPVDKERGVTGPEARRALGHSLRCSLDWRTRLIQDKASALRNALATLATKPVVTPAWPFAAAAAEWASAPVSGGLVIAWRHGWSAWTLTTPDALAGSWDFIAPALWGFAEIEADRMEGTEVLNVRVRFEEDGPAGYALLPESQTWSNGPALADGATLKAFPFRVNWTQPPTSGLPELEVDRQKTGPARASATTYFPQLAERPLEGYVTLTNRPSIARLMRWWMDRRGSAEAHVVSTLTVPTRLTAPALAGTTTLSVGVASTLGADRLIELADHDARAFVRVASISGNTLTLTAALNRHWAEWNTRLSLAMLARHAKPELEVRFASPTLAEARFAWREVPAEVAPSETRGATIGALPITAYLYEITEDYGGGATTVHRVTSFERDITASAQTWTSRPGLDHGELRRTLKLDRDETTLKGRWWPGCPFEQFLPGRLSALVRLKIYQCTVDPAGAGTSVSQIFGGEITKCPFDGPEFTASAAGMYSLFDRPTFAYRAQKTCNATAFTLFCGLDLAAWTFTAETVSVSGASLTLDTFARAGGLPDGFGFAQWFSLGFVERTVGGKPQRYLILASTALSSGAITLTLDRTVSPAPAVDDVWTVVPGCDGRAATCKAWVASNIDEGKELGNPTGKFNHFANFKGFDELPDKDPAFQPLKKSESAAGKK